MTLDKVKLMDFSEELKNMALTALDKSIVVGLRLDAGFLLVTMISAEYYLVDECPYVQAAPSAVAKIRALIEAGGCIMQDINGRDDLPVTVLQLIPISPDSQPKHVNEGSE